MCRTFSAAAIAVLLVGTGQAQQADPEAPGADEAATRPDTELAAPEDAERNEALEEVLVVGQNQNPWRLPDLGSEWRSAEEENKRDTGRIQFVAMPLYNPETDGPSTDFFTLNANALSKIGYIELFRLRFGGRR